MKKGTIMTKLLQLLKANQGPEKVQFFAPYVWLYRPEEKAVIIKLEEFRKPNLLCVNASFARDGSGPLLASFMSMLLIEDSHATMMGQIGICSGRASVTIYHCLDVTDWNVSRLMNYLTNFEKLTLCILPQAANLTIRPAEDKRKLADNRHR